MLGRQRWIKLFNKACLNAPKSSGRLFLEGEKEKAGFTAGGNILEEAVRGNSGGDETDRVMVRQPFVISFKLLVMSVLIWRMHW